MKENNILLPSDKEYLEIGLPEYLKESIKNMEKSWSILDNDEIDYHWDATWCSLNSDINVAEVEQDISHRQADYLRKKYLRMENEI